MINLKGDIEKLKKIISFCESCGFEYEYSDWAFWVTGEKEQGIVLALVEALK